MESERYAVSAYILTREVTLFKDSWLDINELNKINGVGGLDHVGKVEMIFEQEPPPSITYENMLDILVEYAVDEKNICEN